MEKLSSQEVKELSREPFHWICNPVPINVDCKSTKNNQRIANHKWLKDFKQLIPRLLFVYFDII